MTSLPTRSPSLTPSLIPTSQVPSAIPSISGLVVTVIVRNTRTEDLSEEEIINMTGLISDGFEIDEEDVLLNIIYTYM